MCAVSLSVGLFAWAQEPLPETPPPTVPVGLSASPADPDATPRWSELNYGVSLTPPPGSLRLEGPSVVWAHPGGYKMTFELVYSEVPITLEDAAERALVQLGFAKAGPRLVTQAGQERPEKPAPTRIADRPGFRLDFETPWADNPPKGKDPAGAWRNAMAIVMLEPYAAAVLHYQALPEADAAGRAAFDAVLASIDVPLVTDLDARRRERVEAGDAWLKQVSPAAWRAALPTDAWYRLIRGDRDVGHVRIRSTSDPDELRRLGHTPPGLFVRIDRREYLASGGEALDSRLNLFASDDGRSELWDRKSSLRSTPHVGNPAGVGRGLPTRQTPAAETWAETGVRSDRLERGRTLNALTVVQEFPAPTETARRIEQHERFLGQRPRNDLRGRVSEQAWVVPETAYLNQIQVWALSRVLPPEPAVYGFSAYHPRSGRPGLRTVEVQLRPDGGRLVLDRPNSRLSPTRVVFDADGRFVESVDPAGLRTVPTTPEELARLWQAQDR